jgi:hypothetical protein
MTPAQAQQIVLARWVSQWLNGVPFRFTNEGWNPGVDIPDGGEWASCVIRPVIAGRQHTLGAPGQRKFERTLLLVVEIHTPSDQGSARAVELASEALDMFTGWREGGIFSRDDASVPETLNNGRDYVVVVEISFTYYQLK